MSSIHEIPARELQRVAEAVVFAAEAPVPAADIAAVYAEVTGEDRPSEDQVVEAVARLNDAYEGSERVFRIERWAEGYRMATVPSVAPFLKSYFNRDRAQRLSRSLLETLAIVAYRQPVTKPEIDFVRGVDCGYAVNKLMEKALIDVVGRSDSLGRPLIYGTTRFFLEQFGLGSLDDLPDLREIEDILSDPAFNRERAALLQLQREGEREETPGDWDDAEGGSGREAPEGAPDDTDVVPDVAEGATQTRGETLESVPSEPKRNEE